MKQVNKIFMGLMLFGSINLMADYVAGYIECKHSSGNDYTRFIVTGYSNGYGGGPIAKFLNAEYASATNKYCEQNKVWGHNGHTISFDTKAKANSYYSELINESKDASYVKKIVTISYGYDERDWE